MDKDIYISSNMEDYLEAIANLKKENGVARVKDIGRLLNVKTPSVNSALNTLSNAGLVKHERYGYVDLTEEGEAAAHNVIARHETILRFLTVILGIDQKTADEEACKMEHSMCKDVSDKLTKFMDFVGTCQEGKQPEWLKNFYYYLKTGIKTACNRKRKDIKNE